MIGNCKKMCTFKEYCRRNEVGRLSRFESDEDNCIAEFTRPGVGQMANPIDIRTGDTLMKTTVFLLGNILDVTRHGESWLYTTDFITDRLRQVRKETMQQDMSNIIKIYILERIIRYHILLMYNNREYDIGLNKTLFQTYLSDLMDVYNDFDEHFNYYEFRSYFLLNNISNSNLVFSELNDHHTVSNENYQNCIHLYKYFHTNNYYNYMKMIKDKLSLLQSCILLNNLNSVRISFLRVMNKAFGLKFPMTYTMRWLLFDKKKDLIDLLKLLCIKFDENFVYFSKDKDLKIDPSELDKCNHSFSFNDLLQQKFSELTPSAIINGGMEFFDEDEGGC